MNMYREILHPVLSPNVFTHSNLHESTAQEIKDLYAFLYVSSAFISYIFIVKKGLNRNARETSHTHFMVYTLHSALSLWGL